MLPIVQLSCVHWRSLSDISLFSPLGVMCYAMRVFGGLGDLLQEVTLLLPSRKVDTELCREETVRCGHMRINGKVGGRLIY